MAITRTNADKLRADLTGLMPGLHRSATVFNVRKGSTIPMAPAELEAQTRSLGVTVLGIINALNGFIGRLECDDAAPAQHRPVHQHPARPRAHRASSIRIDSESLSS
jgi:hypothetical protein